MYKKFFFCLILCSALAKLVPAQSNADSTSFGVPNVFTPNNDRINDVFRINSDSLSSLTVEIFNRWGNKIAEMKGINDSWDGRTPSGEEVPTGTYFYSLKATNKDGSETIKNGEILLLR